MLVGLEEGKFLEEAHPGQTRVGVRQKGFGYLQAFLEFGQHGTLSALGDVVGGVHRGEGWGQDRHQVR